MEPVFGAELPEKIVKITAEKFAAKAARAMSYRKQEGLCLTCGSRDCAKFKKPCQMIRGPVVFYDFDDYGYLSNV